MKAARCKWLMVFTCLALAEDVIRAEISPPEFRLQFIQHMLNTSNSKTNFVVAPHEAYMLYNSLYELHGHYWPDESDGLSSSGNQLSSLKAMNISKDEHNIAYSVDLRSRWGFNFQSRDTRKLPFHQLGSGDHRSLVDFMTKDLIFRYWEMDDFNASVIAMSIHHEEMRLFVILPNEYVSLDELKQYFAEHPTVLQQLMKKSLPLTLVRILIPKFRFKHKQDLKEFFEKMYELPENATTYQQIQHSTHVNQFETIQQVAEMDINERGIGNFDKITVLFWNTHSYMREQPKLMNINRPFLFMITSDDVIHFFGQVVKI